jgi:SAM-dependent methyltransferase
MMTANGEDPLSWSRWLDLQSAESLLDIGCNVGHLLQTFAQLKPSLRLSGIEVNRAALDIARTALPSAALHVCGAEALPFGAEEFDCITCIEVLEHIPAKLRRRAMEEAYRVLKPGGYFVLQVPHDGTFAWLDPGNFRFRFPRIYSRVLGRGHRDDGMQDRSEGVLWHHHFDLEQLGSLTSDLFAVERVHHGGLFLTPAIDIARWPFYKLGIYHGRLFNWLGDAAHWDMGQDYGRRSYDVRLLLRKPRLDDVVPTALKDVPLDFQFELTARRPPRT